VEQAYRLGDFAGSVTLLIESQEDGVLARVLAPEGASLPVGTPIALVYDGATPPSSAAAAPSSSPPASGSGGGGGGGGEGGGASAMSQPESARQLLQRFKAYTAATKDVYDESQPRVRVLEWQSYLKESKEPPGCSKCMG